MNRTWIFLRSTALAGVLLICMTSVSCAKTTPETLNNQAAPHKLHPLATATLRSLETETRYGDLKRLDEERYQAEGEAWPKTVQGQRVRAALKRLRTEAESATVAADPADPNGRRSVIYTGISGRVARLSSFVPPDENADQETLNSIGSTIADLIKDRATGEGLFLYDVPSPEHEAMEKGITAAKQGDYAEALIYFKQAQEIAIHSADIFYNMGLAESMMSGRELRAISWFGAYLSEHPGAANRAAVQVRMAALKAKSEKTIRTFLQLSEETAKEFTIPYFYDNSLFRTAVLCAEVGDGAAVERIERLIADPPQKSFSLHELLQMQLRNGDTAAAEITENRIQDPYTIGEVQLEIADAKFRLGDLEGARETLTAALESPNSTEDACYKSTVLTRVAEVQIKQGDISGAKQTLVEAKQNIVSFDRYSTIKAQCLVAEAEVRAGDVEAAEETFAAARNYADAQGGEGPLLKIAEARARTGDIAEAVRIVDSIMNPSDASKDLSNIVIITEQLKAGDLEGAQATANKIEGYYHRKAMLLINESKMKQKMDSWYWRAILEDKDLLGDTMFLDLAGEMKSLSLVEDPTTGFEGVLSRARVYFEAHQTVHRMVDILLVQESKS